MVRRLRGLRRVQLSRLLLRFETGDELHLGQGAVDWDRYLNALEAIGYRGYLTVEREVGANPEVDIRAAVQFLRSRV